MGGNYPTTQNRFTHGISIAALLVWLVWTGGDQIGSRSTLLNAPHLRYLQNYAISMATWQGRQGLVSEQLIFAIPTAMILKLVL